MLFAPTVSVLTAMLAIPEELTCAVPRINDPSLKVTNPAIAPSGDAPALMATVAQRWMVAPALAGFTSEVRTVVVAIC